MAEIFTCCSVSRLNVCSELNVPFQVASGKSKRRYACRTPSMFYDDVMICQYWRRRREERRGGGGGIGSPSDLSAFGWKRWSPVGWAHGVARMDWMSSCSWFWLMNDLRFFWFSGYILLHYSVAASFVGTFPITHIPIITFTTPHTPAISQLAAQAHLFLSVFLKLSFRLLFVVLIPVFQLPFEFCLLFFFSLLPYLRLILQTNGYGYSLFPSTVMQAIICIAHSVVLFA